ncbi:hypothetical protein ACLB2K_060641 [Fragaria x ananassa]
MEIQYQSNVRENEKKLSIPVKLAAMAGITNLTGNPIAFSPPFLSHRSSTLQTEIRGRSGMTIQTRGHRLDAERPPDEEEQSASLQGSRDRGRSGLELIHSYLYISQIQRPRSNHQYFYF